MKIILMQQVQLKDFREGWRSITKTFESVVIPHKGDLISDSVWKDPYEYEVIEVSINYQENECYVTLKPIQLDTNEKLHLKKYIDMTKLHGWECKIDI